MYNVCMYVCVCACVRACVRACIRVYVRAREPVLTNEHYCLKVPGKHF